MEEHIRELIEARNASVNGSTNPFLHKVVIINPDDAIKCVVHR
jgi:hypothetical protein